MQYAMIQSNFPRLKREKAARENRDITLREIAEKTELSLGTLQKLNSGSMKGVRIETLEALYNYFGLSSIADLVEFTRE